MPQDESSKIIDIDDLEDMEHQSDVSNTTFLNPSQDDKPVGAKLFKCKISINDHKEQYHNWCSTCFSSFCSQENLKNHTKKSTKKNQT